MGKNRNHYSFFVFCLYHICAFGLSTCPDTDAGQCMEDGNLLQAVRILH